MDNKLKQIRTRLRLAMNGVVSTSMREKGVDYKLNFGVSLPKIKEIAASFEKEALLAETLWQQDVREMKILATLLYPIEEFTIEIADRWGQEVRNQEIAEQYVFNLLQELPFAETLAARWIYKDEEFLSVLGFLLYTRLCMRGIQIPEAHADLLIRKAIEMMDTGLSRRQQAALLALKHFGRQKQDQADTVLRAVDHYKDSESYEKQELYDTLKFEFDYYG